MRIVELLALRDDPEVVNAHLAFQLNAGVDAILVADAPTADEVADVLEPYARSGVVRLVASNAPDSALVAAAEQGADWVLETGVDCFWWPRGESLTDVLAVIPARYTVVQALVRPLSSREHKGESFWEQLTTRPYALGGASAELRPIRRVAPPSTDLERTVVPLRAWYPVEVFDCSPRGLRDDGLAAGSLVEDTRLRDALRALLRDGATVPRPYGERVPLPTPDIVDDAAYAVECAAVGEVDLPRLEREVAQLEDRVAWLEQRFWPRVWRRLSRLGRPRS
jgi:hypothetical protein